MPNPCSLRGYEGFSVGFFGVREDLALLSREWTTSVDDFAGQCQILAFLGVREDLALDSLELGRI